MLMARHGENIRKRTDGRWEARIMYRDNPEGKTKCKYVYGKTYSEAKRKKTEILASVQNKTYKQKVQSNITFSRAAKEWLNARKSMIKESTYVCYANIIEKHLLPKLGALYMDQLCTETIEQFLAEKKEHGRLSDGGALSGKTVADLKAVIRQIVSYAASHNMCSERNIQMPAVKYTLPQVTVLTRQEQATLEQELFSEPNPLYMGILISLYAGLRIGEVCALQWKSFDTVNGTLTVDKTIMRIKNLDEESLFKTKLIIEKPKTQCSIRTIPLPDVIRRYLEQNQKKEDYYVITGTAKPMEPRVCLEQYKRLLKRLDIKSYSFHTLRHTFATRCVEIGFDMKSLSEIMGHSSVSITMQRYVHPSMELKKSQMNRMAALMIQSQKCGQNPENSLEFCDNLTHGSYSGLLKEWNVRIHETHENRRYKMKKKYYKPLVYIECGLAKEYTSNSQKYAEKMKKILTEEMKKSILQGADSKEN